MPTSSIDDLLLGGKTPQHPETPENPYLDGPEEIEELDQDEPDYGDDEPEPKGKHMDEPDDDSDLEDEPEEDHTKDLDEYGNEKPKPRMYTEEEHRDLVNQAIRERVAQFKRNNPDVPVNNQAEQQLHKNAQGFEFDPNSEQSLPQQLESFIEQTVSRMTQKEQQRQQQANEQQLHTDFEEKMINGMGRFDDFQTVVGNLPFEIDTSMIFGTRGMADPAAFLYAAAKRNPQELERISKIRDPYAKIAEMGRLEATMRRNKQTTKAPRPLSRTVEDSTAPQPKKKTEPTIEDLIAKSDARKLQRMKGRQGGRR